MAHFAIRFIACKGPISATIRYVTNSLWSHVEIITPMGYLGAQYPDGVRERPKDYCRPIRERRYSISVSDSQYIRIMNYARSQIGTPYNFGIVGFAIHHPVLIPGRCDCSQFVLASAQAGGLQMLNCLEGYDYRITPETLHLSAALIGKCTFNQ
jgi:uncharacterized protein YycO